MILFNWKEMTCNIFLPGSLSKMYFQLSLLPGMKAQGESQAGGAARKGMSEEKPISEEQKSHPSSTFS